MRFIVVLATLFSACCCLSILNLFSFHTIGPKSDLFYREKISVLNNTLTDEEILRCKNFMSKIVKDLNLRPTDEKFQHDLSQCSLFLQQNSTPLRNKNESILSPSLGNDSTLEHDSTTEHTSTESSSEANAKITGEVENPMGTSERRENEGSSTSEPLYDENEDLKEASADRIMKPTTESSGLWSFFFGSKGSSSNSTRSVSITEKNEGNSIDKSEDRKTKLDKVMLSSTSSSWKIWNYVFGASDKNESNSAEKPTIKTKNQKTEFGNVILNSTRTSWNLWNYLFGTSGSKKSSTEIRPFENLKSGPTTESDIYFENSTHSEYLTSKIAVWNLVMPGTKWCGSGSTAENDDDLGYFADVDRCCRAHDKCDDLMVPGQTKYNLTNTSPFTVLNCKCDDELYNCLSEIDSVASNTVGNTFFNIFGRMCYTLDYPRVCKKQYTLLGCLEYVINETAGKVFQWKPAKKYLKMPFTISG